MSDEETFRVLLPNGDCSKPYSRVKIEKAFSAGQIPKGSTVNVNGTIISISDFVNGESIPVATKRQKEFATKLGIRFKETVNRAEISRLIDAALHKENEQQDPDDHSTVDSTDDEGRERIRQEIIEEMREDGSIPLSLATPDDISKHFENVRDLDMLIIYSPNNTFEQLIQAQGPADIKGTEIRVCRPEWMSRSALKTLLLMLAPSLRD